MHSKFNSSRLHNKNFKYPSGNAKTDATRTDSKSNKKTFSRENSLSSNRSNCFSKKPSIAANLNNRSISSRKYRYNDNGDTESTSSYEENLTSNRARAKKLRMLGIKNIDTGFPEGIKEETEEYTTKTKMSGKLNNFSGLHKKRTEVEKEKTDNAHLKPNLVSEKQKIRKTLSDPSTIEKHMNTENNQHKSRDKGVNKSKRKGQKSNNRQLNCDNPK